MDKIKLAVDGYGVIGKRVADAVRRQNDMELIGVADVVTDCRIRTATVLELNVYAAQPEKAQEMRGRRFSRRNPGGAADGGGRGGGLHTKEDGAEGKARYEQSGVKAIFQGGESHALTGHSLVAQANFESALGRQTTRVVSCNTTSIVRTLTALKNASSSGTGKL